MQVLWLEDDFTEVLSLVTRLVNCGFRIFRATNIDIAEKLLTERQFDLIVLDSFMNRHGHDGLSGEHAGIQLGRRIQNGEFGIWGATVNIMFLTSYRNEVVRQLEKEHLGESKVFSKNESHTAFFNEVTHMANSKGGTGTHIHVGGDAHFGDVVNTGHGATVGGHNATSTVIQTGISTEELLALERALASKREYEAAQKFREVAEAPEGQRASKIAEMRKWFGGAASTIQDVIHSTADGLKIWEKVSTMLSD